MQRMTTLLVTVAIALAAGCDQSGSAPGTDQVTPGDVRRDAEKAVDTAAKLVLQTKEEYQSKLEARLEELDKEIVILREKGSELKDDAKARWDEKLAQLETKREVARVKLEEIKGSSAEAWNDLQKGAQSAWDDLEKAFREASSEFQ